MLTETEQESLTDEENELLNEKHTITDFDYGSKIPGKLMPVQLDGGTVLMDTTFELRGGNLMKDPLDRIADFLDEF